MFFSTKVVRGGEFQVMELDNFQYKKMRKLMYLDEIENKDNDNAQGKASLSERFYLFHSLLSEHGDRYDASLILISFRFYKN